MNHKKVGIGTGWNFIGVVTFAFLAMFVAGCEQEPDERKVYVETTGGFSHTHVIYGYTENISNLDVEGWLSSSGGLIEVELCYDLTCDWVFSGYPHPDPMTFRATATNSLAIEYFEQDMEYCADEFSYCSGDYNCVDLFCLAAARIDLYLYAPSSTTMDLEFVAE